MIFPFESLSDEHRTIGLGVAVAVGIAFGFVLERAGFGRAQKLVGQFYGTEMVVFKVMFTAVLTAMVGTVVLGAAGILDLRAVSFNYPTYLWPMLVGGLLLGAGMIMSGYCPGTSIVATASGKLDGLFATLGVMVGGIAYAELLPHLGSFNESGKKGAFFLPDLLHVPRLGLAAVVVVVAVFAFKGAEKIERLVNAARASKPAVTPQNP